MKSIQQTMLEDIEMRAIERAREGNQTVGDKNDYYITLEQLAAILMTYQD